MSHITLAQQGLAAVEVRQWDEAVAKLSRALQSSPNPAWLLARSKALIGLRRFPEALDDADLAWHTAYGRNKRPLLANAHYRRAVAYYRMGQYANADCCCIYAMRVIKGFPALEEDPKAKWTDDGGFWTATAQEAMDEATNDEFNRGREDGGMAYVSQAKDGSRTQVSEWRLASTLRMQILRAMESLPADDEARKVTVSLKPEQKKLADVTPAETTAPPATHANISTPAGAQAPPTPDQAPLRLQEFQSSTTMSVSIFSKGVDKDELKVEFLPSAVHLDPVIGPDGQKRQFSLQLWGVIDPLASKYTVTPSKVELSLAKKTPVKWSQLLKAETGDTAKDDGPRFVESDNAKTKEADPTSDPSWAPVPRSPPKAKTSASAPSYPSSSRSGARDWDKIGMDEVGDDDDDDDVNLFFKKLYQNATPEQQRAMMKSFTESNGTSLSTDWNDVKARKVETVPPEGVEAKKWE